MADGRRKSAPAADGAGFADGCRVIEDDTAVQHDLTRPYRPSRGGGIAWEGAGLWRAALPGNFKHRP